MVFVFCDTDKKPYEQYEDIKRKINEFHGIDNAASEVVIFVNPCTMQIISRHWTDENCYRRFSGNIPSARRGTRSEPVDIPDTQGASILDGVINWRKIVRHREEYLENLGDYMPEVVSR